MEIEQIDGRHQNQYNAFDDGRQSQENGDAQEAEGAGQDDVIVR